MPIARSIASALFLVRPTHLLTESATMPAPAWTEARFPRTTIVRIAIANSRFLSDPIQPTAPAYPAADRLLLTDDLHRPDLPGTGIRARGKQDFRAS